jgi:hypothetical protein
MIFKQNKNKYTKNIIKKIVMKNMAAERKKNQK